MSNNYDNWERLVAAVLRREQDREVALADSRESSFRSLSSSSRFGPDSSFHEQNPELEAYNSDTVNLLGNKMQKIVIKVLMNDDKSRNKALKTVVGASGIISADITGEKKDQVEVVGEGIDGGALTMALRKKMGFATLVSVDEAKKLKEKMGVLGIEGQRGEEMAAKGKGIEPAFPDDIIIRLLTSRQMSTRGQVQMSEKEIRTLCTVSRKIFLCQPNLLELDAPIKICGNIHGQYGDLLRLFKRGGFPPDANYLFLGGYVGYGRQSIETICLLLAYKIKYPENFFLLRGNHESASINRIHGFYDECKRRYNVRLWKVFTDCFNCLPVAALIEDKILCMHGGLSPDLHNFDQIRTMPRPTEVPKTGLLCDLLWSDPVRGGKGWGMSDRGVSYTFGSDKLAEFLIKHDLDLVCRGHEVVEDGYEFFADRQLVTIFSAPNFRGEYDNAGAMMNVDDSLMCSFHTLEPANR